MKALRAERRDLVGDPDDLLPREDVFADVPEAVTPPTVEVLRAQGEALRALCEAPRTDRGPAGVRRRALRVLDRVRP